MKDRKQIKLCCPRCGHFQAFKLRIGQIWINDRNYKVKVLDFGFHDVWLLYLENNNKVGWKQQNFLEQYTLYLKVKDKRKAYEKVGREHKADFCFFNSPTKAPE